MNRPFSFLDNILNILIIEDDPESMALIKDILDGQTVFCIHTAVSSQEALNLLKSGKRFHICIMDLGLSDIQNDEFFILRQYAQHTSIIVLTGSSSPQKGAICIKTGARGVFEKGTSLNIREFLKAVHHNTLISIINHRYNEFNPDTINLATKILFEKKPASVTEWADYMKISDRQLRNLWHNGSGFSAKYTLAIYTLFSTAFSYFHALQFESKSVVAELLNSCSETKLHTNFKQNSEIFTFLLS
ncbi:MAG TPA: response regulator [Chitinispirillaceae bacterium]|nr:response regulator [Chitinispirillaceae bacterium]